MMGGISKNYNQQDSTDNDFLTLKKKTCISMYVTKNKYYQRNLVQIC